MALHVTIHVITTTSSALLVGPVQSGIKQSLGLNKGPAPA